MPPSLGLTLYNLGARRETAVAPDRPTRPAGRLVWLHIAGTDSGGPMLELARRLAAEAVATVLVTGADGSPRRGRTLTDVAPPETLLAARAFLDHWTPDMAVMTDRDLRPALLHETQARGVPVLMVDARGPAILPDRSGWWPGLMRGLLQDVDHVLVPDEGAARALRKAGARPGVVQVTGALGRESAVLSCTEAERAALARTLASRPVWLAASLPDAEEAAVITAHREGLRLSHRLLLIIVPQDPDRTDALAAAMEADQGWIVARRSADQEPEPDTEVYVADASEFGLWYRLAPITYLGGSLSETGCLRDPMEAAALGSAILAGSQPGGWRAGFARLNAGRAMRTVGSGTQLADALGDLLSPDRAARLANAAWAVASDGAEATETALRLIRQVLERTG